MPFQECLSCNHVTQILEYLPEGIAIIDQDETYMYINKAYERLVGVQAEYIVGKKVRNAIAKGYISSPSVTEIILKNGKSASINQKIALTGRELLVTGNPIFNKSGNLSLIVAILRDVTELNRVKQELEERICESNIYKAELERLRSFNRAKHVIYQSKAMADVIDLCTRVAPIDATILITGETGVGKEVIARLIHDLSQRASYPFLAVNCGAIPANLVESELFGYDEGAFTGAKKSGKPGLFEMANLGTLFLDEIGDLNLKTQATLLRVLQDQQVRRVGGTKVITANARIISATNKDLPSLIKSGEFREDLYYRINVVPIRIPPLRERKEDIPDLTHHFIEKFNKKYGFQKAIAPNVLQLFYNHDWPGNVRELEHTIERLLVTSDDQTIDLNNLAHNESNAQTIFKFDSLDDYLQTMEKQLLQNIYGSVKSTRKVAKILKISQATVVRRLQQYGIATTKE